MARPSRTEAVTWLLFSAGGMAAALIVPVLLLLFGVAFPLGALAPPTYEHLLGVLHNPLVRIGLFLLCALALAHWAHRFRHALGDLLRVKALNTPIAVLCYGATVAGSVWAAIVLFR